MRLNPDCIRDILIEIENNSEYNHAVTIDIDDNNPLFNQYTWQEIIYHINQCALSDLLSNVQIFDTDGYIIIDDLTPSGHEFLSNIRQDSNWNIIKKKAMVVGSFSLNVLKDIASAVIAEMIKSQF